LTQIKSNIVLSNVPYLHRSARGEQPNEGILSEPPQGDILPPEVTREILKNDPDG